MIKITFSDGYSNDSKILKQLLENPNIVSGFCESLKNASNYRVHILEKIKNQIEIKTFDKEE